jgi:fermentation-respiration switch protein FrsA (DUF1100 family)
MILKYALLAAAIYGGLCLTLVLFQSRLVFLPSRTLAATPARIGFDYEEVWLQAPDGARIHGWFVPHQKARGSLLFLHGNAGNIGDRLESIAIFHRLGLNILIIDYHGYGKSEGSPGEAESYADAETAWRYLVETRRIPAQKIVLFGRSLGGCVAAWLAARVAPAGLILESTFTSVPDMAAKIYPFFPVRLLARIRLDAKTSLASVRAPVLVIHSADDEIVPVAHGRALFDAAPEPKRFLELRGGHNDGFLVSREVYLAGLSEFMQEIFLAAPAGNQGRGIGERPPEV